MIENRLIKSTLLFVVPFIFSACSFSPKPNATFVTGADFTKHTITHVLLKENKEDGCFLIADIDGHSINVFKKSCIRNDGAGEETDLHMTAVIEEFPVESGSEIFLSASSGDNSDD